MVIVVPVVAAAVLGVVPFASASGSGTTEYLYDCPKRTVSIESTTLTNSNVDVSPDGKSLLFDSVGNLYVVPIGGGKPKLLRGYFAWESGPTFSPDGSSIAFVSDAGGPQNLWVMSLDDGSSRQITNERTGAIGSPRWSRDGNSIIARNTNGKLLLVDISSGDSTYLPLRSWGLYGPEFELSQNSIIYSKLERCGLDCYRSVIIRWNRTTGEEETLSDTGRHSDFRPRISDNGRWMAFFRASENNTVLMVQKLPFGSGSARAVLAVNRGTNIALYARLSVEDSFPSFDFTPDSSGLVVIANGQLLRMNLESGSTEQIPVRLSTEVSMCVKVVPKPILRADRPHPKIRWPSTTEDRGFVVFESRGKIWIQDTESNLSRRLTGSNAREYAPSLSPDGNWVAYIEWSDSNGASHVRVASVASGTSSRASANGFFASPAWASNGEEIAVLGGPVGTDVRSYFGMIDSTTKPLRIFRIHLNSGKSEPLVAFKAPRQTDGGRHYSTLSYSPDDESVFYFESGKLRSVNILSKEVSTHTVATHGALSLEPSPSGQKILAKTRDKTFIVDVPSQVSELDEANLSFATAREVDSHDPNWLTWVPHTDDMLITVDNDNVAILNIDPTESLVITSLLPPIEDGQDRSNILTFANAQVVSPSVAISPKNTTATLTIEGERLVDIADSGNLMHQIESQSVDLRGKYVVPGFVDTHVHWHSDYTASREYFPETKRHYVASLAYGVTSAFDPAAPIDDVVALRSLIEHGEMIGPRLYATGDKLYGPPRTRSSVHFNTSEDAFGVVRRLKDSGAIAVKSYLIARSDWLSWLTEAARAQGLGVTVEGGLGDFLSTALFARTGVSAIEHLSIPGEAFDDYTMLIAKSGTSLTPTLLAMAPFRHAEDSHSTLDKLPTRVRRFSASTDFRQWLGRSYVFKSSSQDVLKYELQFLSSLAKFGGRFDIGSHSVASGLGFHMEMWLLADAGISEELVLKAATQFGAQKLGLESELGSLEEGKLADFLVLNCNPLDNIRCTADIEYVVKGGVVWHADSMTQMWPEYKPLPKPWWHSDEDWEELKPELPEPWEGVPIAEGVEPEQPTIH